VHRKHRFANRSLLIRLRLAALLFLLLLLSLILLPPAFLWFIYGHDTRAAWACLGLVGFVFVFTPIFLIISADVRCPLCRVQVLGGLQGSVRNSKDTPLLGSHRLRVIARLFFTGHFRCMHCGEPCDATQPRHRH
jgi:hypothetical protein